MKIFEDAAKKMLMELYGLHGLQAVNYVNGLSDYDLQTLAKHELYQYMQKKLIMNRMLHVGVASRDIDLINKALDNGADIMSKNRDGDTLDRYSQVHQDRLIKMKLVNAGLVLPTL